MVISLSSDLHPTNRYKAYHPNSYFYTVIFKLWHANKWKHLDSDACFSQELSIGSPPFLPLPAPSVRSESQASCPRPAEEPLALHLFIGVSLLYSSPPQKEETVWELQREGARNWGSSEAKGEAKWGLRRGPLHLHMEVMVLGACRW